MKISRRVASLQPSLTLALTAKAKALKAEGIDVISFGSGEPDFDTPDFIKEIAIADLSAGKTKYTAAKGGPEILDSIVKALKRDYSLDFTAAQVMVSVGGKHSLYNIFQAALDPGDEVIVPSPFWLSYPEQIRAAEGEPVIVTCGPEQNFKIVPEQLEAAITPKTVAFVFNSPSNPTGTVYTKEEILALAEVLRKHPQVLVISDDLYQKLVYAPAEFHSMATLCPDLLDRFVIVNGWSKAYSMTGWRLGWLAGPEKFVKAMASLQSHATSNVTTFIQRAAAEALSREQDYIVPFVEEFDARRKLIVDGLNALPGVSCPTPEGAFYAFPDVSGVFGKTIAGKEIGGSIDFADVALEKARVSVVPGAAFGEDRCIRMSYATSRKNIAEGLARLKDLLAGAA